jgi:hypothetical protein
MKIILALIAFFLTFPAWAASCTAVDRPCNCIAVVFDDEGLPYTLVPWSGIDNLQDRILSLSVASYSVYYTQFGSQGGPTSADISGANKRGLGLKYVAPTRDQPREQLIVSEFSPDPSAQQHQGFISHFTAALDDTEDVTLPPDTLREGANADHVLLGTEVIGGIGTTDTRAGAAARNKGTGVILTDVLNNGCP